MIFKNDKHIINNESIKNENNGLDLLKKGDFNKALEIFNALLKKNYSNLIAESGLKCIKYWNTRLNKIKEINDHFLKGKSYFEEWNKFEKFIKSIKNVQKKVISNIMYFNFNSALEEFKKSIDDSSIINLETSYMTALSYKKIGDYINAIKYFKNTLNLDSYNSNILCQLADCYALIDEEKKAKILFREAFYIDASSIDITLLDSNIINYLITKIIEYKIPEDEISCWLPVFGRVLGILTVKRELLPIELGKLKKEIYSLESYYYTNEKNDNKIKAKLLNYYLWLYDHENRIKDNNKEIKEIEYKIKSISSNIYNLLMNNK